MGRLGRSVEQQAKVRMYYVMASVASVVLLISGVAIGIMGNPAGWVLCVVAPALYGRGASKRNFILLVASSGFLYALAVVLGHASRRRRTARPETRVTLREHLRGGFHRPGHDCPSGRLSSRLKTLDVPHAREIMDWKVKAFREILGAAGFAITDAVAVRAA
ncbi:hypothetical protein [Streptomyces sp. NPDC006638]|uniref:hypothetical protein n=1 Tax=unclassified Streptomyces TaxID=2593676 RepID=UPI0033B95F78